MAYVYAYHVPELDAIKIGHGTDPSRRLEDYTERHGLHADYGSLVRWRVGDGAPDVERLAHEQVGLRRLRHGRTRELFALGPLSYEQALDRLDDVIGGRRMYGTPVWLKAIGTVLLVFLKVFVALLKIAAPRRRRRRGLF